ncbi:major head protein [Aeromonas phage GomatiRiver_11]|nr:capsid vertex protein [Aeromonas phage AhFM11]WKW84407.1 major head protein [Aeromonas phage GomatiRiver_11]
MSVSKIHQLLSESTTTAANSQGRPALVGLTRSVNALIYSELVAIQETTQPTSTLYGVRYFNPNGDMAFQSMATYGGHVGSRDGIQVATLGTAYIKGDVFQDKDTVVYEVLKPFTLTDTGSGITEDAIYEAVIVGNVRIKSESAPAEYFESGAEIVKTNFKFDRWNAAVKSRKLKSDVTVELMQDLEANKLDAPSVVEDVLATMISEDINKDIIQTLGTVSTRFMMGDMTKPILDLTTATDAVIIGRTLYQYVCEMKGQMQRQTSFDATYALCSVRVGALLSASGWLKPSDDPLADGELYNGMKVYVDAYSSFDYVVVGCKHEMNDIEHVGSLFFSPYVESDNLGSYKIINDAESLQPHLCMMIRYGLSVNPYTTGLGDDEKRITQGDDWSKLAGQSRMSYILGVKLPKIIEPTA